MRLQTLKALSDEEVDQVHEASLEILAEVGVRIPNAEAQSALAAGGAEVDRDTHRVKISPDLVERCVASAPSRFALCNRDSEPTLRLGEGNTYAASGHGGVYVYEYESDVRRDGTCRDVADFTRLADALDEADFVSPQVFPQDVPSASSLLHAMASIFNSTRKHVFFSTDSPDTTRAILDMARAVAGQDDLAACPIVSCQFSPTSPLTWQDGSIQCVMEAARAGAPCAILPGPFPGVTAPYSLMGLLTVHNCEVLSGVVVAQLIRPGTPMIYCCEATCFDMRQGNVVLASPEVALAQIASVQLAGRYHLPTHMCCPETDAHWLDEQHAWEKMLSLTAAITSGVDIIVNIGLMGAGLTSNLEQMVLDNEMIAMVRRFREGVASDERGIPVDLIRELGPGGNFLDSEHTVRNLRTAEFWQPAVSNRGLYDTAMKKQSHDAVARATARVKELLAAHRPTALDKKTNRRLDEIIRSFETDHL